MDEERATPPPDTPVTLRPVSAEDEAFLLTVYASARAQELAQVPWSDAQRAAFLQMQFTAQQNHYRAHFPDARHEIIEANDLAVGRLYVDRREQEIRILDITVLPEYRRRGIGSSLLRALMDEAAAAGKSVTIHVENFNPSRHLFERLGYRLLEDDGLNLLFEWRSAAIS
jgi:ribosomal protein S18 acetylase RimI-like enzyme